MRLTFKLGHMAFLENSQDSIPCFCCSTLSMSIRSCLSSNTSSIGPLSLVWGLSMKCWLPSHKQVEIQCQYRPLTSIPWRLSLMDGSWICLADSNSVDMHNFKGANLVCITKQICKDFQKDPPQYMSRN